MLNTERRRYKKTGKTRVTNAIGHTTPIIPVRRRATYTKAQKIACVTTMLELGGCTVEAIATCRLQLNNNITTSTLVKWMNTYKDEVIQAKQELALTIAKPTTVESVRAVLPNIANDLAAIQRMILDSIKNNPAQVDSASLRDKMVSIGISVDKLKDYSAMDPAVRDAWKNYEALCLPANYDPLSLFNDFVQRLRVHISQNTK